MKDGVVQLKVKYLKTYLPGWPELNFAKPGDSGFDLRAAIGRPITITPGNIVMIGTGVCVQMPEGYEIQVRPRSGMSQSGLILLNSPGTVDSGYRGEIKLLVYALPAFNETKGFQNDGVTIQPGDRLAQGVVCWLPKVVFRAALALDDSERGANGFGSSGIK